MVHADDGLDELSTLGPTQVCELRDGQISQWTLDPGTLGLGRATAEQLRVSGPDESAAVVRDVLAGRAGPAFDIAALNAAAGLVITGRAGGLDEGLARVRQSARDGNAVRLLATLSAFE